MTDFVSQINAMSDTEFDQLESLLIWTTERQLRKARLEAAERGECIHGVELDTGEEWPCRECFYDEYPTQADFDARNDDRVYARRSDPETSKQGPHNLTRSCRRVLGVIRDSFGVNADFTDGDLAVRCRDDRNIVARRRKDLVDLGFVQQVGRWTEDGWQPTTRLGRRGRHEEVWRMTLDGLQAEVA